MCHKEIEPLNLYLLESFLYKEDTTKTNLIPVEAFAISSYPGNALTFKVSIKENGAIFDFVPFHKLFWKKEITEKTNSALELKDLVYCNSPSEIFVVNDFSFLKKRNLNVFLKHKQKWLKGKYLFTVDWYLNNENLNVALLESGHIAAIPNHKCLFTETSDNVALYLPKYRAVKENWSV